MRNFQVPVWFNVRAESREVVHQALELVISGRPMELVDAKRLPVDSLEFSIEDDNMHEYDENGDEVDN